MWIHVANCATISLYTRTALIQLNYTPEYHLNACQVLQPCYWACTCVAMACHRFSTTGALRQDHHRATDCYRWEIDECEHSHVPVEAEYSGASAGESLRGHEASAAGCPCNSIRHALLRGHGLHELIKVLVGHRLLKRRECVSHHELRMCALEHS